jgi:hypothetical protein
MKENKFTLSSQCGKTSTDGFWHRAIIYTHILQRSIGDIVKTTVVAPMSSVMIDFSLDNDIFWVAGEPSIFRFSFHTRADSVVRRHMKTYALSDGTPIWVPTQMLTVSI